MAQGLVPSALEAVLELNARNVWVVFGRDCDGDRDNFESSSGSVLQLRGSFLGAQERKSHTTLKISQMRSFMSDG